METTVSQMSVGELRKLISDVVDERLKDAISDPDYGLEFREDFVERVRSQQKAIENGERLIPFEEVLADLGIDESELEAVEDDLQNSVQ